MSEAVWKGFNPELHLALMKVVEQNCPQRLVGPRVPFVFGGVYTDRGKGMADKVSNYVIELRDKRKINVKNVFSIDTQGDLKVYGPRDTQYDMPKPVLVINRNAWTTYYPESKASDPTPTPITATFEFEGTAEAE